VSLDFSALTALLVPVEFLLPGYAWLLVTGVSKRFSGLSQKLSLCFILSISFESLVPAGFSVVTPNYLMYSMVLLLGASATIVLVFLLRNRNALQISTPRLSRGCTPFLVTVAAYVAVLSTLYWTSPYYPSANAFDPVVHSVLIQEILQGEGKMLLLHGGYALGMHFATALLARVVPIGALGSIRVILALVVLDSLALVYFCARVISDSAQVADMGILVAAFAIPVEALHYVVIGTYSNIIGDAVALTMVWLIFSYLKQPNKQLGVTLAVLGAAGAFMHSSFLLFLGVLVAFVPIVYVCSRKTFHEYTQAAAYSIGGFALFVLAAASFFQREIARISAHYLSIGWNFSIGWSESGGLPSWYVHLWDGLGSFVGSLNVLAIWVGIVFTLMTHRKSPSQLFLLIWLGITFAISPFFSSIPIERMTNLLSIPAILLVANLIGSGYSFLAKSKRVSLDLRKHAMAIVVLGLLFLTVSGTFLQVLERAYNPAEHAHQTAVVQSMDWLTTQSRCLSGVASVGLWNDYRYFNILTGIRYAGEYFNLTFLMDAATVIHFGCVAANIHYKYFNGLEMSNAFREQWRNADVAIFFTIS
jgi:hypothetical protein